VPSVLAKATHQALTGKLKCCRSLAASQQEVKSLEGRLSQAEQAEGDATRAVREAEAAAVDQESLLLRAAALEDKLKESRAEQGQLENYKQVSQFFLVVLSQQAGQPLRFVCVFLCFDRSGDAIVRGEEDNLAWNLSWN